MPCGKKFGKPSIGKHPHLGYPAFGKPTAGGLAGVSHELDEMRTEKFGKPTARKLRRKF